MKIGMIGLGKLGLPVAVTIARKGYSVMGYDLDPKRMSKEPQPYQEMGLYGIVSFNSYLEKSSISFGPMKEVADHSDIIFIAVQTPHNPIYEGITPLPGEDRVDFDYKYLVGAIRELAGHITKDTIIAVISTCLPGTMRREIMPLLNDNMKLVYNPSFIAMGTTMMDFADPEFVLLGSDNKDSTLDQMVEFYKKITKAQTRCMSIESAELTKVLYNTYISFKISYVNTIMEICQKIPGADVDDITDAIKSAYRRIISRQYLSGGMGDGGGCHPRDNIAMSYLARKLGLSYDLFEAVMLSREGQADWLVNMLIENADKHSLPIIILGYAFKENTNIITGSHALLVKNILNDKGYPVTLIDEKVEPTKSPLKPAVYLIGCKHPEYRGVEFPKGSVVIDPFRYINNQKDVNVIRLGEANG